MTPDCSGHLAINTDLCATCERYAHVGDRVARVEIAIKGPARCLDYVAQPGVVADYMARLPL